MNIYVASSWRNAFQPKVVEFLRSQEHEVYDFRHPMPGNEGFSWGQVGLVRDAHTGFCSLSALKDVYQHPRTAEGFKLDFDAMKHADACVLVLPCGNSAHLEAGWMRGQGKPVFVYAPLAVEIEPELMYLFLDDLHNSLLELGKSLKSVENLRAVV